MVRKSVLFAAFLLICVSLNSFAQVNQDFTLVNKTGVTIYKFYVAPVSDSKSWGPDLLGGAPLASGESIEVTFDKADFPDECLWDAQVEDSEGNTLSWFDIDLCKWYTVTLFWDANKAKGWAEFK